MNDNPTKKRILSVALKLFFNDGFEKVTINQICKECDINKHTFYYYFKSKDELLSDFYELPYDISADYFAKIMDTESCVEQLRLLFKPFFSFMENTGVAIAKQIISKNFTTDVGTFKASEKMIALRKLQISIISNGQKNMQIKNSSSADQLCTIIHHCAVGTCIAWCLSNGKFDFSPIFLNQIENILDVTEEYKTSKPMVFSQVW